MDLPSSLSAALTAAEARYLAATRRTERPRLARRPLPPRWTADEAGNYAHAYGTFQLERYDYSADELRVAITVAEDVLSLLEWLRHDLACDAQDAAR